MTSRGTRTRRALAFSLFATGLGCAGQISNFDMGMDKVLAGDEAAARPLFEAALADPSDAQRAQAELDEIAMHDARDKIESDPAGALAIYQRLLAADPDHHRARMGVGHVLELERRFDEAIKVLSENPACKSCAHQLGETYEQRGRQRMANADFDGAMADYEKALAVEVSPEVLIDISEMYSVGHHGTALAAAQALQQALPHIKHENTTLQELWSVERRDLVLLAAAQHKFEAVQLALKLADPRVALDSAAREHALLDLKMESARTYQAHQEYKRGHDLGIVAFDEAAKTLPPDQLQGFKDQLMGLYSVHAHHLVSIGESRDAIVLLTEALQREPDHALLRYQAVLAMSAIDQDIAEQMIQNIPETREHWHRVHALIRTGRAQRLLAEGDYTAAQIELGAAGKEFPDLLEVRLVRAEILAQSPVAEWTRNERKALRADGAVKYPGGKVMRFGEALAEVQWCRGRFEEESAQLDPLRMPGFGARLSTLEADITAFYPFAVTRLPKREPRIRFTNGGAELLSLEVEGPAETRVVELKPGGDQVLVFEDSGLVSVSRDGGKQTRVVAAELRTLLAVDAAKIFAGG